MDDERFEVEGSERTAVADERIDAVDAEAVTSVTVYLRQGTAPTDRAARISREAFAALYGADPADVAAVAAFAAAHALEVGPVDRARRSVVLTGRTTDLAGAFGVQLSLHRSPAGWTYPAREGAVTVPASVAGVITGVFGLDQRPQVSAQLRVRPAGATATPGYAPTRVAEAYHFPAGTDGTGQTVALIELGGGYRDADLTAYFAALGSPVPQVSAVSVDGGANAPGSPGGPDGEVMLDIEVVGAVAPRAAIAVYFAPNTDQGFLDAVTTAVHDQTTHPSVVSISWGGPESSWTAQAMAQMEQAFADAAVLGVTVIAAAGDNGSTDGVTGGIQHVDFPASAPHALACGGTTLTIAGSTPAAESVWGGTPGDGATGGGISDTFGLPGYQDTAHVPPSANPGARVGRGVPDVAGNADPRTGYAVRVDGQDMVIGGTSAVAPLWAGLVVRLNQALGRHVGDLHASLYGAPGAFNDVTVGSNGAYGAGPGWDPCTGLGSPDGERLLQALLRP